MYTVIYICSHSKYLNLLSQVLQIPRMPLALQFGETFPRPAIGRTNSLRNSCVVRTVCGTYLLGLLSFTVVVAHFAFCFRKLKLQSLILKSSGSRQKGETTITSLRVILSLPVDLRSFVNICYDFT